MEESPVHVSGRHSGRETVKGSIGFWKKLRKDKVKIVLLVSTFIAILFTIITVSIVFYQSTMGASINRDKYQAVFLTNGQVYFGKLQVLNGGYVKLSDIYYLQSKNPDSKDIQKSDSTTTNVELVKLGAEIHGPDDEMIISKDQILFFENIKNDGTVSQTILKDKKK